MSKSKVVTIQDYEPKSHHIKNIRQQIPQEVEASDTDIINNVDDNNDEMNNCIKGIINATALLEEIDRENDELRAERIIDKETVEIFKKKYTELSTLKKQIENELRILKLRYEEGKTVKESIEPAFKQYLKIHDKRIKKEQAIDINKLRARRDKENEDFFKKFN